MFKFNTIVSIVICIFFITGCSTITTRYEGTAKLSSSPTYEKSKPYFLWGLVGEHHINVKELCGDKKVSQMQSQDTFLDGFLGFITLGIYLPRTAKVWCE